MELRAPSLRSWFFLLVLLNILDILVTKPAYEINPFTLYVWEKIGIFLSALMKMGLVSLLGVLFASAKKVARPSEWPIARKILLGIVTVLVAYYTFVVSWNTILFFSSPF